MTRRARAVCAFLALAGGVLGIAAGQGLGETTTAAWTDQTLASATVTAGSWEVATPTPANSCTAYDFNGKAIEGCSVNRIEYYGWGTAGSQTRNYYIYLDVPSGTRSVTFDVDLSTATGNGTTWSWTNAGVVSGAQFTARDGWTCGALPRVQGTGADWHTSTIYFQVAEDRTASTTMCS